MKVSKWVLALALTCIVALPALAQSVTLPPLAAVEDGKLIIHSAGGDTTVPLEGYTDPTNLVWSPDGQRLLFVAYDANQTATLLLTNLFGDVARTVASGLTGGYPGVFADANTVLYVRDHAGNPQPSDNWLLDIYRTGLTEGAEPELVGSFATLVGCGGGSPLPGDWQYWQEAGFGGSGLILAQTPSGIVHSISCGGGGTALLDTATGEDKVISDKLSAVTVSPDGKQIAGIEIEYDNAANGEKRTLVVADLSTLAVTPIKTPETIGELDQVTWSADGSALFYTAREPNGEVALTADEQKAFNQITGMTGVDRWTSSLHRVDPSSGQDTTLTTLDAYVIARVAASPDGKSVYLSAVSNMDAWAKGIAARTVDSADSAQQTRVVPVLFYRVDLSGGPAVKLSESLNSFSLNRAAMPAS